ncbi:type IV pilin protein [Dyella acidisoli]|nr:prepilin-type N-terminal cleavage/methylation domain-containing protein [Dyella acidisoli]
MRSTFKMQGFTLIEVMVVIGLVAFLLTLGIPLAREWVLSAHQREAKGALDEALGRAKALALRNPQGLTDQTLPAAAVCLTAGKLVVVPATAQKITCDTKAEWAQSLPSDATIVLTKTNIPFQCVAYNERGVALVTTVSNLSCLQAGLDVNVASEEAFFVQLP